MALAEILAADARLAEEARARSESATPGPWTYDTYGASAFVFVGPKEEAICDLHYSSDTAGPDEETELRDRARANAALIAAARTDVPALCARLDAYREALEIATQELERRFRVPDGPTDKAALKALAEIAAKLGGKP